MFTITTRGIENSESGEFATWAEALAEWKRQIHANDKPVTPEQESDRWFAFHGVPSKKSLKTLDAKLAANRAAEAIENGSEEL